MKRPMLSSSTFPVWASDASGAFQARPKRASELLRYSQDESAPCCDAGLSWRRLQAAPWPRHTTVDLDAVAPIDLRGWTGTRWASGPPH